MTLEQLISMCDEIYSSRSSTNGQDATGAVGHIKKYPVNGDKQKTIFVAKQNAKFGHSTVNTTKTHTQWSIEQTGDLILKFTQIGAYTTEKIRTVDDCRNNVTTRLPKGEWTGYHAEMLIVNRWLKLLYPTIQYRNLSVDFAYQLRTNHHETFSNSIIAANADCCLHCHNLLTWLGIQHPTPSNPKRTNTGWWNPLTDFRAGHGTPAFAMAIPDLEQ